MLLFLQTWKKDTPNYYEFAIIFDGLQIGAISVALNDERNIGEMGWIINKRYWKRGIALEAALAIKDFAIYTLNLSKIVAHCDYRNVSSYNLMQKIGMTLESNTGIRTYPKNNETVQELTYSVSVNK
jgi:ribosomal-protein-alanine N-acetyltransferase